MALGLALGGCSSTPAPETPGAYAGDTIAPSTPGNASGGVEKASFPAPLPPSEAPGGGAGRTTASSVTKPTADAKESDALVVYVGDLTLTTDAAAIPSTLDEVIDVAESLGGHLAGRTDTTVKVKIPSRHFREGMTAVEKLADVSRRSVSATDVTAEFKDAQVRLENLRATRKRLEEFLARAQNIQDTLTVEQQLERVALEIDTIQGRLRVLQDQTAYSVLSVAITPKPRAAEVVIVKDPTPKEPPPPRSVALPIEWLGELGIGSLLDLRRGS
jgi:hypothetical protein